MKKNSRKRVLMVLFFILIISIAVSSAYALVTCMQCFGRKCGGGGCQNFDYCNECTMHCVDRLGNPITIVCK